MRETKEEEDMEGMEEDNSTRKENGMRLREGGGLAPDAGDGTRPHAFFSLASVNSASLEPPEDGP